MIKTIKTLSGEGEDIHYKTNEEAKAYDVKWGASQFIIPKTAIDEILTDYFVNPKAWYPLWASVDPVHEHGLGEFLHKMNIGLTSRHASALAAILVQEGFIKSKKGRPIYLQRSE